MEQREAALAVRALPLAGAAASLGGWARWAAGPIRRMTATVPVCSREVHIRFQTHRRTLVTPTGVSIGHFEKIRTNIAKLHEFEV